MINYNKASFCILPILDIDRDLLQWNTNLINCYIGIKEYPEYSDHIVLLYKFNDKKDFTSLTKILNNYYLDITNKICKIKSFITFTNNNTEYHFYVFNQTDLLLEILPLFKKGKYSQFSQSYKDQIERIHKVTPNKKLYHILRKTDKLRKELEQRVGDKIPKELDLWSIPYKKDEILTLKNLK